MKVPVNSIQVTDPSLRIIVEENENKNRHGKRERNSSLVSCIEKILASSGGASEVDFVLPSFSPKTQSGFFCKYYILDSSRKICYTSLRLVFVFFIFGVVNELSVVYDRSLKKGQYNVLQGKIFSFNLKEACVYKPRLLLQILR